MTSEAVRPSVAELQRDGGRRWQLAPARLHVTAVTAACIALYLVYSLTNHLQYRTRGYDLGIFDQAVRAYANFRAPVVPLKGPGFDVLGDHFSPIIATLAPLYWIWANAYMLLFAQAVLVACSIPVVYRFARRRGEHWFALAFAGLYGAAWPMQNLLDYDFHEVAFAVPILALAIDALDRRAYRALVGWSALLLLVREDMGILVAIAGLIVLGGAWWRRGAPRGRARWVGVGMALGGIVAYELATGVIIPAFAPGHQFAYWQFDAIGGSLPDAVWNILSHPWHAASVFVTPIVKLQTLSYLVMPLALLCLRSPYVLIALPLLAERFFNSRSHLWIAHFQYDALPWLVLALAAVDGAGRLGLFAPTRRRRIARIALVSWLAASQVGLTVFIENRYTPGTNLVARMASWGSPSVEARRAIDAFVPSNVCVAADSQLAPHITGRDYVTLPTLDLGDPDFILLDMSAHDVGNDGPKPQAIYVIARAAGYDIAFRQGREIALVSPSYAGPSAQCHPLGRGKPGLKSPPLTED